MNVLDVKKIVSPKPYLESEQFIPGVVSGEGIEKFQIAIDKESVSQKVKGHLGDIFDLAIDENHHLIGTVEEINLSSKNDNIIKFKKVAESKLTAKEIPIFLTYIPQKYLKKITQKMNVVMTYGKPVDFPHALHLNISKIKHGEKILLKQIKPPTGIEFSESDLDQVVVTCQ